MALRLSLVFVILCALVLVSNAATLHKRDTEQTSVISDANQAIDNAFEGINKGIKKLADDGIDINKILQGINQKAQEFTSKVQAMGKELGDKVQQAAKEQGIAS